MSQRQSATGDPMRDLREATAELNEATSHSGDHVKLMFRQSDGWSERRWVVVDKIGRRRIVGYLNNEPLDFPRLYPGRKIIFRRKHIIDILPPGFDDTMQEQHVRPICSERGSARRGAGSRGRQARSAAQGRRVPVRPGAGSTQQWVVGHR